MLEARVPLFDHIPFEPLFKWLLLFGAWEFLTRLVLWMLRRRDPKPKAFDLYLDPRFTRFWVVLFTLAAIYQMSVERVLERPSWEQVWTRAGGFIVYFAYRMLGYNMTAGQRRQLSHGKLGPGLATAFFSYVENGLKDPLFGEAFAAFVDGEDISPDPGSESESQVGSPVPLILFPDLRSYLRREDEIGSGLVSGVVRAERKAAEARNVELEAATELKYEYTDQAGQRRYSEYSVFSVGECDPEAESPEARRFRYFFVLDNRPLLAIQRWYEMQEDLTESELDLQLRWYKRRLLFLLRTSGLDHRCAVLEFRRGELLDALGEHTRELHMEKLVQ